MRNVPGVQPRIDSPLRVTAGASAVTVLAMLPVFLVGALAVLIRSELGFNEAALGIAVAGYFLMSSLASIPGGLLSDRVGARPVILLAGVGTITALVGIAAFTTSWSILALLLLLAGVSGGVAQPAANLLLAQGVGAARQGLAFGAMKAAAPTATLLAGAAVPALGLTVGWRWAFAFACVVGLLALIIVGPTRCRARDQRPSPRRRTRTSPALKVLAVALGCASIGVTCLSVFFVESAVRTGVDLSVAGTLLAVSSAVGVAARILVGWFADRHGRRFLVGVAVLLVAACVGSALLAFADGTATVALAAVIGFGPGWAWPGLLNLAVVRHNRNAPATAIGVIQTGGHFGAVIGPPIFGALVAATSFRIAWTFSAAVTLAAAVLVVVGREMLERGSG